MLADGMNQLLIDVYACPTDRARWHAVLDQVRSALTVRCAALQVLVRDGDRARLKWAARDSESQADVAYHDPYISGDSNPRYACRPGGRVRGSWMFMRDRDFQRPGNPDLAPLHRRLEAIGLGLFLGARIPLSRAERLVLAVHRDVADPRDFSDRDEAFIAALMPHLRQAVYLCRRLDSADQHIDRLHRALDRMQFGAVFTDAQARPTWWNRPAEQIFGKRDGIWISHGRLMTPSHRDTDALYRMIGQASAGTPESRSVVERCMVLAGANAHTVLQLLAVPLNEELRSTVAGAADRDAEANSGVLLLFATPSQTRALPMDLVARLLGLSPAEARLTVALCQGLSVAEYASAHSVSVGTARFQLKQVLAKTQVCRQAELVRRVYTSIISHAAPIG